MTNPRGARGTLSALWPAAALIALALPSVARAQRVMVVQAGVAPTAVVLPHGQFTVPIVLNMSAAGGADLAALTATVTWSAAALTLDSIATGGFGSLTSNALKAAGSASISVFSVTGTSRTVTLAQFFFSARAGPGRAEIAVTPTVAGNEVGHPILGMVRSRPLQVCVTVDVAPCASEARPSKPTHRSSE